MAMDLKDFHMTAEELAQLTKCLTLAIAEQIDWNLAESRILELFDPINDDQRSAIHQMIEESKADNPVNVFDEHLEDVTDLYQDLMDDDDTDQEEPEEE